MKLLDKDLLQVDNASVLKDLWQSKKGIREDLLQTKHFIRKFVIKKDQERIKDCQTIFHNTAYSVM